ncbi:MAG: ribonuclease III [Halanaerobiaceae bacterium]
MVQYFFSNIIKKFEKEIGIEFSQKKLLQRAITHKSFSNEKEQYNLKNNERLEFLGDSVLSIIISTYIFDNFPDYPEGELAKMRSVIVSEPILAIKARELNLGKYLLLGKGEEQTGGRDRDSIMADAMEALIAAVYLDRGFEFTSNYIIDLFKDTIKKVEKGKYIQDYKTMLQEIIQKKSINPPVYLVVEETGPDHNKEFKIEVKHNKELLGIGTGKSKKEAEQDAARTALEKLGLMK